ncbi:MAG: DUF2974 domain-containing protein [Oscillibacter sp.]|nr:DUF2974 domain-containing protein [Oscillibacter sp.]
MANILDYLDWRGDLTLTQDPFNEVDNLILAELSFVNFGGIVPAPGEGESVPLQAAAEQYFAAHAADGENVSMGVLVPDCIPEMLKKMAQTVRFRDMGLNCFVDWLDVAKAEQFAALSIDTGDGGVYCSFRGTDDTIAGWKEDFLLSCMDEIPAQKKTVEYVTAVAKQFPRKKLLLGGHSKGGNLAVYGGVFSPAAVQKRIAAVYSNDGPGFHENLLTLPEHERIEDRIFSIVPKSSVVGMLLEHEEAYTVVDSTQLGLMQHDGFSWEVMGDHFVTLRQITRQGQMTNLAMREWVHAIDPSQREKFVDALFAVLSASGAVTLTDLKADSLKSAAAMVKAMKDLDKETRVALLDFMGLLFKSNFRMVLEGIQEETEKKLPVARKWTRKKNLPIQ